MMISCFSVLSLMLILVTCPIDAFSPSVAIKQQRQQQHIGQRVAVVNTDSRRGNQSTRSVSSSALCMSSTASAPTLPDGILKTVTKQGNEMNRLRLGDIATVKYSCYLPGDDKKPPFAKSTKQKVVVGDMVMIEGWEKAIRTMNVGERSIVRITDPRLAYGPAGVLPLIPPNAEIEIDIEILDAQAPTANINFDSLADSASTPKTASDIAAAFERRQAAKAQAQAEAGPAKEGLEAFIEKAKNFYFFGLFEGETGERPPWFLRPSITFPLAFAIVGAAFYVLFLGGGITERGVQVKDELDEYITMINDPSKTTTIMVTALTAFLSTTTNLPPMDL